jgi:hypothetical protein
VSVRRSHHQDKTLPDKLSILIDVSAASNGPSTHEIAGIRILIEKLRSRFGGRIAIFNNAVGHVWLSHLIAYTIEGGIGEVQAFVSESEAKEWLR